ncbi:MAG TPA: patatin-like phospholipase family protein, partial [Beijerinckiaceae bacterium]
MRDLRIIALLLIGTSVALTALDQGNDVMRDHVDGANVAFASWSPQPAFFRWIALFVSCVFAGVNAWYWSHLLYKSHGPEERSQPGWYVSLRRLMGVMPLLAAASAMLVSVDWALSEVWLGVAIFVGGALLLHRFFAARLSLAARMPAPLQRIAEPARFGQGRLAIGDVAFATASLLTAVALFTLFLIPSTRVAFAWRLGPAAVTFLAVGCIIPVTSLLIWSTRAQRVPVVGLGLLAFAGCSLVNDNHAVRPLDPGTPVRDRVALEAAYAAWAKTLKPTDPVVLVAAAGGASRAAYWAASVLRALDEASGERFSRHVFAISGVSGGALGAVAYAGWTSGASAPAGAVERRSGFLQQFLGDDFLSPAVAGMLFPDLLQRFLPAPLLPSRAVYLEEAWERGWRKAMGDCRAAHASACGVDDLMAADFLAMWSGLLDQRPDAPWTPLVFSNGTHVQTGKRIITAPVRITPDAFEDAIDFFDMFGHPVRASTAVHNSARFPIVSPAGRITGHLGTKGHVVDGGYFENGGLETVYDIARAIRRIECKAAPCPEANQRRIIIIEISNDDLRDKNSISRRQAPGDTLAAPVVQSYWGSPPL